MSNAIRLSIKFFKEIKGFQEDTTGKIKAPDDYKMNVMKNIEQILAGGMRDTEMDKLLDRYKAEHPSPNEAYNFDEILSFFQIRAKKTQVKRDPNNLLEPGMFYYHPILQVAPKPPVVKQRDDGSFYTSYEEEEFFLEIKESFTFDDLVAYFYEVMELNGEGFKERDIGAFKHILRSYDLDTVLYTIREARFLAEDLTKPIPKSPFDIRDYVDAGMAVLEERKNICYMEGLDRVIPRTK